MGLSRLSKKCRECNKVDRCSNKRMEGLAYIGEKEYIGQEAPIRTVVNITVEPSINMGEFTKELEKAIKREKMRGRGY